MIQFIKANQERILSVIGQIIILIIVFNILTGNTDTIGSDRFRGDYGDY